MTRGVVVGKFYPFHHGHAHLIKTAKSQVDHLIVLVCDRSDQIFSGEERASWIRECFPHLDVRVLRDIMNDEDSELWARYTINFLGFRPDVVFTSEDYGTPWATFLQSKHVLVDQPRTTIPISATKVRAHPYREWQYLSLPVRAKLARRVAIMGAESTGTTTLAKALAEKYQTTWVPEFGRMYSEGKMTGDSPWETREFRYIAAMQNQMEDALARQANKILFCDTNAFATRLWHERYMKIIDSGVEDIAKWRKYDLIILTAPDIPFVQDGVRDGESIRHAMHTRFIEVLNEESIPFVIVSGSHKERMDAVIPLIENLLENDTDVFWALPKYTFERELTTSYENV
jgi:HTH-type transcriptional regulator, transcriptional repressor of NAD biosynthesis genes